MQLHITSKLVLYLPDFSLSFEVHMNASDYAISNILIQVGHPVAFEGRKLSDTERLYSVHEKEMTAMVHYMWT